MKEKKTLLNQVFNNDVIYIKYEPQDMISLFMSKIGYPINETSYLRLNKS